MAEIISVVEEGPNLIVTTKMEPDTEPDKEFKIIFHVDAIGSRMAMYGLNSPQEALASLVLEHYRRLSDLATPTTKEEAIEFMNEDMQTLTVVGCADVDTVVTNNLEQITDAFLARVPEA
jgi:uncharacterized UBP type Zn finger protein